MTKLHEPAAWLSPEGLLFTPEEYARLPKRSQEGTPLYPVREWVGLTKEEAKEISLANRPYVVDMVVALEKRLKEKNT